MALSNDLISQFVKVTKDEKKTNTETTVYGTAIKYDGKQYVKIDGSELLTPVNTTASIKDGEKVTVMIKDHTATVTGNISSPSASNSYVNEVNNKVTEFGTVLATKVSTTDFEAETARIDTLVSDNVVINQKLKASEADISTIKADNVTINNKLTANEASITKLNTEKVSADFVSAKYATIDELTATNTKVYNIETTYLTATSATITDLQADKASIKQLEAVDAKFNNLDSKYAKIEVLQSDYLTANEIQTTYLTATQIDAQYVKSANLDAKYAKIDLTNIGVADVGTLLANIGLINQATIVDGHVTGYLDAVEVNANNITTGTLTVDRLIISGSDKSIVYALNNAGELEQKKVIGRNLLLGTKDFEGDRWINLWEWEKTSSEESEFSEYSRYGAWNGIAREISVKAGEEYTFSFYANVTDGAQLTVYNTWDGEDEITEPADVNIDNLLVGESKRYSVTFRVISDGTIYPRVENRNEDSTVTISRLKLEIGDTATDWTTAPEDEVNTINGEIITKRTISADHIIAGSITANEIAGETITGDKIAAGSITAGKLSVTSLDAIAAKIGSFDINNALYTNNHSAYDSSVEGVYLGSDYISLGIGGKTWFKNDGSVSIGNGAIEYDAFNDTLDITASSITLGSSELASKDDIKNIKSGGRNLFKGTKDFSGDNWINLDQWEEAEYDESWGLKEYSRSGAWEGVSQGIEVKEGEEYTFSFYANVTEGAQLTVYTVLDGEETMTNPHEIDISNLLIGGRKRYSATFTAISTGTIYPRVENQNGESTVIISGLKFERGNVTSDWTQAPEDMDGELSDINNSIIDANTYTDKIKSETIDEVNNTLGGYVTNDEMNNYKDSMPEIISSYVQQIDNSGLIEIFKTEMSGEYATNEQVREITKYIRHIDGCLILGEEGSQLITKIENGQISFIENFDSGNPVTLAYITNQKLYIENGEIFKNLVVGDNGSSKFAFESRANGNLSFRLIKNKNN